ncbi:S1 family peptidase [Salinispira pacifica]|uniref:Serine protease n=1 Tax=Salinispira pacifica TaxID=1307761 RepID=V5WD41_9SPIO|nr:serine protease [Salinispira pacifica]AHC13743.1 hypothetical protein L21SP2_0303 [Salinispira pacifica]
MKFKNRRHPGIQQPKVLLVVLLQLISLHILSAAPGNLRLVHGFPVQNALNFQGDVPVSREFAIHIHPDVFSARITLRESRADLDLYLYNSSGDLVSYAEESSFNESIYLDRLTAPSLENGEYRIEVLYQLPRQPVIDGRPVEEIPFQLELDLIRRGDPVPLETGVSTMGRLRQDRGMIEYFLIDLPPSADTLRVDIFGAPADIDFALNPGEGFTDPYTALYPADSHLASESLTISTGHVSQRRFFLMVYTRMFEEQDIGYSIRVSADDSPPPEALEYPELPRELNGLERAVAATVELAGQTGGGSGCVISPDGFILSNYHVILDQSGQPAPHMTVGLTLDQRSPARELFTAEVVRWDAEKDLALLKVISGRYGQALPEDFRLNHFSLGEPRDLKLSESLHFLGYPAVGGLGSKVTISYTRGTVSGFEQRGEGLYIKSDGEINYGNSGGAAMDRDFRLMGIPTQINPDAGGKLAYIHAVSMVPESWLELAGTIAGKDSPGTAPAAD